MSWTVFLTNIQWPLHLFNKYLLYTVQNLLDLLYFDTSVDAFLVLVIKYHLKRNKSESHSVLSDSLSMEFSSKNTGVGCHSLLQGIFLTQGLNLSFLYCR